MPTSISVFAPARVARGADAADLGDHFVGRLAQVGEAVRVARRQRHQHQVGAAVERALGALQVRHQHRDDEAGQRLRERDAARRCRRAAAAAAPERTSRPRSRAGRRRARRGSIRPSCARSAARADALQAVAQADFADDDAVGEAAAWIVSGGAADRSVGDRRHSRRSAKPLPAVFRNPRASGMERLTAIIRGCATSTSRRFACSSRSATAARWRAPPSRSTSSRRRSASASPSSRTTSASSCWCAAGAACRRRRPGWRCSSMRAASSSRWSASSPMRRRSPAACRATCA